MQSSRCKILDSKLMTCPRLQILLRIQLNITATWTLALPKTKIVNNLWHDSGLIATEVCSQLLCCQYSHKWNQYFETLQGPALSGWVSIFNWNIFEQSVTEIIIFCVTKQPSTSWSGSSVLIFKFSIFTFLRSTSCLKIPKCD